MKLLFGLLIFLLAAPHVFAMDILLDPGHGGRDRGTQRGSYQEANITLQVARRLAQKLKNDPRFHVTMTRNSDQYLSLSKRTHDVLQHKADIFISIHVNSSPDPRAHGAEFYFENQLAADEASMFLAHQEDMEEDHQLPIVYPFLRKTAMSSDIKPIVKDLLDTDRIYRSSELCKTLKVHWRGHRKSKVNSVRQAPFYVLSKITVPSTLVELGFLTNDNDLKALISPHYQDLAAQSLYEGLVAYYKESMDKRHSHVLDSLHAN